MCDSPALRLRLISRDRVERFILSFAADRLIEMAGNTGEKSPRENKRLSTANGERLDLDFAAAAIRNSIANYSLPVPLVTISTQ